MQQDHRQKGQKKDEFFTEYGEANRYKILEVIGKGSYGVVCSAIDTRTGEKVAIKKINDIFEHISDALRILREIKLLRLLRHPDIVEIKCIMLPPSRREFKDIYVVFELMESDLHQVIKANNDLTLDHHRFFLYQMLRALKYMHTANVYHRDLKPKNILANSNCKLKICDFGLARVAFNDAPATTCWTDYVATRWYRAPELCGSFFSKYTPAIDMWSIGCIFAEVLTGKPLFPGKSVVHQLDLMTDLLGTPSYSNNKQQAAEDMCSVGTRVTDTTIPENIIRPSRPPPRLPGRIVSNDHPADTRIFIYNSSSVKPSSKPIAKANQEKPSSEINNKKMMPVVQDKEQQSYGLVSKKPVMVLHNNNIGMNKDPYYHNQHLHLQATKVNLLNDQIALNARLLHEQSQFSARTAVAVAVAAHHREFGLS